MGDFLVAPGDTPSARRPPGAGQTDGGPSACAAPSGRLAERESKGATIIVSEHAEKRCRERMGIPRRAVARTAAKAWCDGVPVKFNRTEFFEDELEVRNIVLKLHGEFRFVFGIERDGVVLITVVPFGSREERRRTEMDKMGLSRGEQRRALSRRRGGW